jgi:alkylation response protein AidB-like acyl-CoA dehydrogenase
MKFALNENQAMCQESAREFCCNVLDKYVEPAIEEGKVSEDVYKIICDAGFMGLPFEEKYGGAGLGFDCYVLAMEQFARHAPGLSAPIAVSTMFLAAVLYFGTEAQKQKYIAPSIAGDIRGSFAFTEPGTGSDPKQITSTYRKEGNGYVLNGVKRFITNAGYHGPILVFAKDPDSGLISGFIFEKFCEGYSLSTPWELVCNETSPIYDVFMDNIRVPEENLLGELGKGFNILKATVCLSKLSVTAECIGNMGRAYDIAVKYAKEKLHRGQPITKFPTVQTKIAQIAALHQSSQLLVYRLAEHANDSSADPAALIAEAGMVKGYVADLGVECCQLAMTVLGAYGVCKEYHIEHVMRDALHYPIVEGAGDLQRIMAGSYILKP